MPPTDTVNPYQTTHNSEISPTTASGGSFATTASSTLAQRSTATVTASTPTNEFPPFAIALIVVGLILALAAIIAVAIAVRNKRHRDEPNDNDADATQMTAVQSQSSIQSPTTYHSIESIQQQHYQDMDMGGKPRDTYMGLSRDTSNYEGMVRSANGSVGDEHVGTNYSSMPQQNERYDDLVLKPVPVARPAK